MATAKDLQNEIQSLMRQINTLNAELGDPAPFEYVQGRDGGDLFEKENERIENYLSEFTHREGVLLTIAGLLSLFPFFETDKVMPYFLLWVTPFLILAIIFYVCSAKRLNIVSSIEEGPFSMPFGSEAINRMLKQYYFSVMKFHRLTDAILAGFFASFIVNYYLLVFIGVPGTGVAILVAEVAILVGLIRYYYAASSLKGVRAPMGIAVCTPCTPTTLTTNVTKSD